MKWGRVLVALLTALQVQTAIAQQRQYVNTGFLPIDLSPTNGDPIDDLPPTQPRINPQPSPSPSPNSSTTLPANSNATGIIIKDSGISANPKLANFSCNLFTNNDYSDILSAANMLNQAVSSPSCNGSTLSAQTVVDNNKKITDAIAALQPFLNNPETVQPEQIPTIVNTVDSAIRAANALATSFAGSDPMNKNCRDQMNGGQIALAINDMINGLTPYALMAASMTGGTAAIPFIVGGTVITSAISSMEKIVNENSTKIKDPSVRRAVLENTCQYIRLDQKYKFIMRSRDEQVVKITTELTNTRNLLSVKVSGVSDTTNDLIARQGSLNQAAKEINSSLDSADAQLASDKQFVQTTTDDIKICQLGIQLAQMSQDRTSYVSTELNSVDMAMAADGTTNIPQARVLKASGQIAVQSLQKMASLTFNFDSDFTPCSRATKSFIETIEQSGKLSRQVIRMAQANLDKELQGNPEYMEIQSRRALLVQKQQQAARITNSLDNLRKYATTFNQSEIDSEMDRLRTGLFSSRTMGIASPVMSWFTYTTGLHRASIIKFKEGLSSLRTRAYKLTTAGSTANAYGGPAVTADQLRKDQEAANNMATFTLTTMPKGSQQWTDTCREASDVWSRWVTAMDHLNAVESFCQMINGYIFDNRTEDQALVQMCRGSQAAVGSGTLQSDLAALKTQILNEKTNAWANLVKKRIDGLACQGPATLE